MEVHSGLRSRSSVTAEGQNCDDLNCEKRLKNKSWSPVRLWAIILKLLNMKGQRSTPILVLACLGLTTTFSWFYLSSSGKSHVGKWEQEYHEEWHNEMGRRVREKLEKAKLGEDHHILEEEEAHWARTTGIEIGHDPDSKIHFPEGESLNIAIAMPFLDQQPLVAAHYIKMLEWITIYSSVRIHFHVITNEESKEFVDRVMEKVNMTSNCYYDYDFLYFDHIIEFSHAMICKEVASSEDYCDLLIGQLTPLIFPYLFPSLPYIIYIDKHIVFHDDVGKLYNAFLKLEKQESIAMVQEQTLRYMRAFGTYHMKSPSTKLGRPPSRGKPGYNPDLLVMDLHKLRGDKSYKAMIHELKISLAIRKYSYHPEDKLPNLGDILNLLAAEKPKMFHQLSCDWNKSAMKGTDPLSEEFLDCLPEDTNPTSTSKARSVRATNNNPNLNPTYKSSQYLR